MAVISGVTLLSLRGVATVVITIKIKSLVLAAVRLRQRHCSYEVAKSTSLWMAKREEAESVAMWVTRWLAEGATDDVSGVELRLH